MEPMEKAKALFFEALESRKNGRVQAAETSLLQALALVRGRPQQGLVLSHLSILALEQKRFPEARQYCEQAMQAGVANEIICMNFGLCLMEQFDYERALESFRQALLINPDLAEAYLNQGNALQDLKRFEQALASYDKAIALRPDYADAYYNKAGLLQQNTDRLDQALVSYDKAIEVFPEFAQAHNNRGLVLEKLNRHEEAMTSYDRAIVIAPGLIEAYNNRGLFLHALERLPEALASFDQAIARNPDYADALSNRGNVLKDLGRFDEAIASFDQAIALKPEFALVHWNKALALLATGDFARGWREYEWRWKDAALQPHHGFAQPAWLGDQDINGKTILIHDEQGLGDTLHFCRYVEKVAALGAKVVLRVQAPVLPLLSDLRGAQQVFADSSPAFDCHCPLMSLPLAFATRVDTIPQDVPYLRARPAKVKEWQKILNGDGQLKVGLVWSGSTRADKWRNASVDSNTRAIVRMLASENRRSIPLAALQPLFSLDIRFVSLQKDVSAGDRKMMSRYSNLRDCSDRLRDFSDTAGMIENLDLVISVDTAVAHLAGAMARPVWIMLSSAPDWRWLLERSDSPWYPTARLFRQSAHDDWASVVVALGLALESVLKKGWSPADNVTRAGPD